MAKHEVDFSGVDTMSLRYAVPLEMARRDWLVQRRVHWTSVGGMVAPLDHDSRPSLVTGMSGLNAGVQSYIDERTTKLGRPRGWDGRPWPPLCDPLVTMIYSDRGDNAERRQVGALVTAIEQRQSTAFPKWLSRQSRKLHLVEAFILPDDPELDSIVQIGTQNQPVNGMALKALRETLQVRQMRPKDTLVLTGVLGDPVQAPVVAMANLLEMPKVSEELVQSPGYMEDYQDYTEGPEMFEARFEAPIGQVDSRITALPGYS